MQQHDAAHDFDFLIGEWNVHHRKLKQRLADCNEWHEFAGRLRFRTILGGLGNIDENILEDPSGPYHAISLRLYSPSTHTWAIYWVDGRHMDMGPPVVGRFADGIGIFEGDDVFEGRAIRFRFVWSQIEANSARWEQAFSVDGGVTWETNWMMRFTRIA